MKTTLVRLVFICVAMLGASAQAQDSRGAVRPGEEVRIALVIGNGDYDAAGFLPNPTRDAEAMGAALRELGFEVFLGLDLDKDNMEVLLRQFTRALDGADVGLFFYAGHGLQVDGVNYIVPTDAVLERPSDLDFEVVDADIVLNQFNRPDFTGLVFLDACRDNPLARNISTGTRSVGRGLAEVQSATGTLIAYATQPGNVAYDGEGDHSPFTQALLNHISTPDMEIRLMLDYVGEDVAEMTNGLQQPWVHFSRLRGGFYFKPITEDDPGTSDGNGGNDGIDVAVNQNDPAVQFYEFASDIESPQERLIMLEQFIRLYPTHPLAVLAATEVQQLRTRAANPDSDRTDVPTTAQNQPPSIDAIRTLTVDADSGPVPLEISAPTDEDGDELTVTLTRLPDVGIVRSVNVPVSVGDTLKPNELASLDYTPDIEAAGAAGELRYRVEDGNGGVAEGVVRVTVRAPNQPPVVQDLLTVSIEQGEEAIALGITAPIDPDNDRLQIRVTWLPRAGTIELNGRPLGRDEELTAYQLIALSYRPDPDRTGDMGSFEYQVDDGRGGLIRATVRISVTQPNTPPTVADETFVEVLANPDGEPLNLTAPTDADGDPLTIRITWTPRWGSVMSGSDVIARGDEISVNDFTNLHYVAAAGHAGDAGSFEFAVIDNRGDPVRGMVRISVIAPNQPPSAVAAQDVTVLSENGRARLEFEYPTDPDGDALELTVTEIPFRGRLVALGRTVRTGTVLDDSGLSDLSYEPAVGHVGAAGQFAFTVTDGASDPVPVVVRISVESNNRAPVVDEDMLISVTAGSTVPLGLAAPVDPDGDSMTIRVLQVPNGGFLRLGSSVVRVGDTLDAADLTQIAFEMTGSELRSNLFSFEVDDGRSGVTTASVSFEVVEPSVVTAPPGTDLAGDDLASAYDAGPLDDRTLVFEDSVDSIDANDYFRFSVSDWSDVDVALTNITGDLDLLLYTSDERIAASSEHVDLAEEEFQTLLPPGTYYILVLGYEGAESAYTLTASARSSTPPPPDQVGNTIQTASMLGAPGNAPIVITDRVDLTDADDYYGFDVSNYTDLTIRLTDISADLDLELQDASGIVVVNSQEGGTNDEVIVATVAPGRYYVHVFPYSGQSEYEVSIQGTPSGPLPTDNAGNSIADAAQLGVVRQSVSFGDWVGTADLDDFIGFDLDRASSVTIRMTGLAADIDMELLDSGGAFISSSGNVEMEDEEIVADLQPGRYYVRVYPFEGQTDYRLDIIEASTGGTGNITGPVESVEQLQAWENSWTREERRQVQRALQMLGYYNSAIDGLFGSGTRGAISGYQQSLGVPATGFLSREQRALLSIDAAEEALARAESAAAQAQAAAAAGNAETQTYDSGDTYAGDRNREGHGVYSWSAGHIYEGHWDGQRDGFGVLTLSDGWSYAGQWQASEFVGFGVATGPEGQRLVGEWSVAEGISFSQGMAGYGQVVYADGSIDRGLFRLGALQPQ